MIFHIGIGIGIGEFLFLLIGIGEFVFFISVSAYVKMSISVSVSVKLKFPYRSITSAQIKQKTNLSDEQLVTTLQQNMSGWSGRARAGRIMVCPKMRVLTNWCSPLEDWQPQKENSLQILTPQ